MDLCIVISKSTYLPCISSVVILNSSSAFKPRDFFLTYVLLNVLAKHILQMHRHGKPHLACDESRAGLVYARLAGILLSTTQDIDWLCDDPSLAIICAKASCALPLADNAHQRSSIYSDGSASAARHCQSTILLKSRWQSTRKN